MIFPPPSMLPRLARPDGSRRLVSWMLWNHPWAAWPKRGIHLGKARRTTGKGWCLYTHGKVVSRETGWLLNRNYCQQKGRENSKICFNVGVVRNWVRGNILAQLATICFIWFCLERIISVVILGQQKTKRILWSGKKHQQWASFRCHVAVVNPSFNTMTNGSVVWYKYLVP